MRYEPPLPRPSRPAAAALGLCLVLSATSCKVVQGVASAPGAIVGAAAGTPAEQPAIDLDRVRQQVNSLADVLILQVDLGAFLYAQADGTPAGAERALSFRIAATERALAAATEPRPVSALADLVALAAFEVRLHELYWSPRLGEADRAMLDAWRQVESESLTAAEACLPPPQVAALRQVLSDWKVREGDAETLARQGSPRFTDLLEIGAEKGTQTSLLGALGLDPLDSIEPAAREVARARELAERGLYLAQRAPKILSWRLEMLALNLAQQPDVQGVLQDLERTSKAAESVAATADALPARVRVEGDALLERLSAEVAAQRAGLVADLERTSPPTQALLAQTEQTLEAGTRMVQALETATRTVDAFVARVAPQEPVGVGAPPAEPEGPPARPFDPVEYTALATQIGAALGELNTAVANLDRSLPAVQRSLDETAARVDRSVESAYGYALRLVWIAVGAVTAAVLLVRALGRRRVA